MAPKDWNLKRAKEDRKCGGCGARIPAGENYYSFKERARSSHEAIHAGLYVFRKRCLACAALECAAA